VDFLILGAGWTSDFLIPLLKSKNITYAATTTTGRDESYKFKFSPESSSDKYQDKLAQYIALPTATTILITFPLKGPKVSEQLTSSYLSTHPSSSGNFIQLGSTGIWTIPGQPTWVTRHSSYDTKDERAMAEDELLKLGGTVLNLSGLWGGQRQVKHWVDRVAATKEQLEGKKSLHMVHGEDVARGIIGVHQRFEKAKGERFVSLQLA
jgi:hypothetical protein